MSTGMGRVGTVACVDARKWLGNGTEIAFIDVREEGEFGLGHPLLAANIPYSRLELEIGSAVPRRSTRVVLIDGNNGVAERAASRLATAGYSDVHVVKGGVPAWVAAGFAVFLGVDTPSKAFAEFVEHAYHTPSITPEELQRMFDAGEDVALLDSRTPEEFRRAHVPHAVSCPGVELVRRFDDVVKSPDTLVVVSCAGRTRSIMGTQSLINAGVPNRVVALRGGTQAWLLANLTLSSGGSTAVDASDLAAQRAAERARRVANDYGVRIIDGATFKSWAADQDRTLYLFDVRTKEEYAAQHRPNAVFVAGGQLVHAVGRWAVTRNARIVVSDDSMSGRAIMAAHWLLQLGCDVAVLECEDRQLGLPDRLPVALPEVKSISVQEAATRLGRGATGLFVDSSAEYGRAHPSGTIWLNRSRMIPLPDSIRASREIVLFSLDGRLAQLAAVDLAEATTADVTVVAGGSQAWRSAGLPVIEDSNTLTEDERFDFLFWNHGRHAGIREHMTSYLNWEAKILPPQVEKDGSAGYRIRSNRK